MKKTFKTMLALMAGAMVFTACSNDDITENIPQQIPSALKPMTFTASMEGEAGATRAAIDGLDIKWEKGDKISIFDGSDENNGNQEFTLDGDGGSTAGTFTGTAATATTYYALYPYAETKNSSREVTEEEAMAAAGVLSPYVPEWKENWWWYEPEEREEVEGAMNYRGISPENQAIVFAYLKGESIATKSGRQLKAGSIEDVVFPAVQTATAGSADPQAMLMIGTSTDASTLEFKNVCAYVKVTPQFDCTRIVLKSNGAESLAGTMTLGLDTDGNPTTTVTANGTNEVTLSGTIVANSTYYIAVRPGTLASGFTIKFTTTDNRYNKSTNKEVTLTRSKVLNLGSFDITGLTADPTTGAATREGDIEVNWVQLWENGPKWAEYNVGAAKAEDYGDIANLTEDFVSSRWGTAWRLPTIDELDKLCSKCKIEWIEGYKGTEVNGLLVTGQEGTDFEFNSIFLPAHAKDWGLYWSSSLDEDGWPCELFFQGAWYKINTNGSSNTYPARAVLAE